MSDTRTCQFLSLRNGLQPDLSWRMTSPWHGGYSMHSTGESTSVENASTLSQILQQGVQERFCLSPKACRGILRRASERGKRLPDVLMEALARQAECV